jgi:hypothetical protein
MLQHSRTSTGQRNLKTSMGLLMNISGLLIMESGEGQNI